MVQLELEHRQLAEVARRGSRRRAGGLPQPEPRGIVGVEEQVVLGPSGVPPEPSVGTALVTPIDPLRTTKQNLPPCVRAERG
jgi:hypothetical protein